MSAPTPTTLAAASSRSTTADHAVEGLPTFLIVGAEKSGTTTLHAQLGAHPDVCVSEPKEPHFFDLHYDEGLEAYSRRAFAAHAGEPVVGEATPTYLNLPFVAERIARDLPHAKLVALLRDPVERAYSAWWMFWVRGLERLPFEEAIRRNDEDIAAGARFDGPDAEQRWLDYVDSIREGQRLSFRTYLQGGWYDRHLRAYLDHFPKDQVKVVLADDLYRDQAAALADVWDFIGARPPHPVPNERVRNAAMGRHASWLLRAAQATRLIKIAPHTPESWRMAFKRATSWMGRRPPLDPAVGSALRARFEPHVLELQDLIDRDLSDWLPPHD